MKMPSASKAFLRVEALCNDDRRSASSEAKLISQLKSVLKTNPEVLNERDIYGFTLLGAAVLKRSLEFIKLLAETDEGLEYYAREKDDDGECLPIHYACYNCNVEVAKYLLSIYPESINIPDDEGYFPLHCAIWNNEATDDDLENLIRFLLQHDQGAVSKHTNLGLPLHLACWRQQTLDVVKLVYNKYPQGIHLTRNKDGKTLLDCCKNGDIRIFFRAQLRWERQARDQTRPDRQGRLPIHRLLQNSDASAGTVELMISANTESASTRDNQGFHPIHYACKFGHLDVVKLLVDSNEDPLKSVTLSGDLPLHIACLEGKCSVINWIMDRSDYGVSLRNKDEKLPFELLLFAHDVDRDSFAYVEAVNHLLRSNPCVLECLNRGDLHDSDRSRVSISSLVKRKHESI